MTSGGSLGPQWGLKSISQKIRNVCRNILSNLQSFEIMTPGGRYGTLWRSNFYIGKYRVHLKNLHLSNQSARNAETCVLASLHAYYYSGERYGPWASYLTNSGPKVQQSVKVTCAESSSELFFITFLSGVHLSLGCPSAYLSLCLKTLYFISLGLRILKQF